MEFKLKTEFVELDNLLKALDLVANGAEAKQKIQASLVKVNGEIELRVRRKLRQGDSVEFSGQLIDIKDGIGRAQLGSTLPRTLRPRSLRSAPRNDEQKSA
ncbi:MAG: RNA-binding S4 domain-containing protein [Candidatus Omnitrophota bacterium]|jgi:ribosome-associated protein